MLTHSGWQICFVAATVFYLFIFIRFLWWLLQLERKTVCERKKLLNNPDCDQFECSYICSSRRRSYLMFIRLITAKWKGKKEKDIIYYFHLIGLICWCNGRVVHCWCWCCCCLGAQFYDFFFWCIFVHWLIVREKPGKCIAMMMRLISLRLQCILKQSALHLLGAKQQFRSLTLNLSPSVSDSVWAMKSENWQAQCIKINPSYFIIPHRSKSTDSHLAQQQQRKETVQTIKYRELAFGRSIESAKLLLIIQ